MSKPALTIIKAGILIWRDEKGKYHRDNDKPAVIWPSGRKEWWVNNKRHRENGKPAIDCKSGYKEWWVSGKFVRNNND